MEQAASEDVSRLTEEIGTTLRRVLAESPQIAHCIGRIRAEGYDVSVITGDRDAFQLVTDHVTVLYPRKGVSDLARIDPAAVEERYGVPPRLYPDLAALVGEQSDNLPGVPGVGPKTAAKWLTQYGDLASIIRAGRSGASGGFPSSSPNARP